MLAIASLATGFVVAAVTPSHGAEPLESLVKLDVDDTLSDLAGLDKTVASDSFAVDESSLGGKAGRTGADGRSGQSGMGGLSG
ncbi:hypothetical protein GCM10010365_65730 [Streptomyces poonensis]|uniref:Secreted protein n=2 Tax=Streptomyces poonensis TaxID=68255 RepID=A0A918UU69_9ACTN|nr:hypothetical protein GCM10010365_65730 [Streptomyces poonensis]GLJ89634.1 hypothetical protein GCM10017589_22340 [Streptomyces poonensis]